MIRFLRITTIAVFLSFISACSNQSRVDPMSVDTVVAKKGTSDAKINVSGQLRYAESVDLTSQIIGRVAQILVSPGDKVTKDQIVLLLDQAELRASLDQQSAQVLRDEARLMQVKNGLKYEFVKLERITNLKKQGFSSQASLDDANFQLEQAQLAVKESEATLRFSKALFQSVKEQLAKTEVRAPAAGVISRIDVRVGETAVPSTQAFSGASLMTIVNPTSLYLLAQVNEAHIDNLQIGQKATIYLPNVNAPPISGTLTSIPISATKVQKTSGPTSSSSFEVTINLDNSTDIKLRPGLNCKAEIKLANEEQRLLVPVEAIVSNENASGKNNHSSSKFGVWLVKGNKAVFVDVTLGLSDERFQEIAGGFAEGEKVIIGPATVIGKLTDQQIVKVNSNL